MTVVTFSGVPMLGGRLMVGRIGWILWVVKVSLMRDVMSEDLPTPSSPQTTMRTGVLCCQLGACSECKGTSVPVAISVVATAFLSYL